MEMITIHNEDYCMDCNTENALQIYDIFNNSINISSVLKDYSLIEKRQFNYIRCKNCNREYNIDWSLQTRVPTALVSNIYLNQFLKEFTSNINYIQYK